MRLNLNAKQYITIKVVEIWRYAHCPHKTDSLSAMLVINDAHVEKCLVTLVQNDIIQVAAELFHAPRPARAHADLSRIKMPLHIKFTGHLRMTVIADDNFRNSAHNENGPNEPDEKQVELRSMYR